VSPPAKPGDYLIYLTYPPLGVKVAVLKKGERNEGTPMSGDEILARNQMAHLIIADKEFAREIQEPRDNSNDSNANDSTMPDFGKMTLLEASWAVRKMKIEANARLTPEERADSQLDNISSKVNRIARKIDRAERQYDSDRYGFGARQY